MDDEALLKMRVQKALREARRAEGERDYREQQMQQQQQRLEALTNQREECVSGLKSAKQSGMSIVQIREYQLLMQHLSGVLEEQQSKMELSQQNFEQAEAEWQQKQEYLQRLQQQLQQLLEAKQEAFVGEDEETQDESAPRSRAGKRNKADPLTGIAGKRLKA